MNTQFLCLHSQFRLRTFILELQLNTASHLGSCVFKDKSAEVELDGLKRCFFTPGAKQRWFQWSSTEEAPCEIHSNLTDAVH